MNKEELEAFENVCGRAARVSATNDAVVHSLNRCRVILSSTEAKLYNTIEDDHTSVGTILYDLIVGLRAILD